MNLYFKKITLNDVEFVNNIRNNYAEEFLHDSRKFSLKESYEWYEKYKPDYWIIFNDDKKIGYFRLSNHSVINKNIYIGADIAPQYRNLGYGKASYLKFIPNLFEMYDLHKISLEVLSTNTVAISLYKSLGFVVDGIKREEVNKNGKWIDSIVMSIIKTDK